MTKMLNRALVLLALAVLSPDGALRAQVDERTIYASVVDRDGAPVTGLTAKEFVVREDDVAREITRVSTAAEPLQIALLVDTSQAIDPYVLDLRLALRAFFKQMAGEHEIALIGFGERPTVLSDYTRDPARLEKSLSAIFAHNGSGTYLMDAVMEASSALRRRKAARPHIFVIAARGPEFSERHHDNVVEALRDSGVTLHTFVLTKPGYVSTERSDQELDMAIADGTRMSGGRRDDLLTSMSLNERLQAAGNELINQYQISYGRPKALIPPKSVEVTVKRPDVTVRARRWT